MAMPTLLQTVLAVVFAALGLVGFWVSIHPPGSKKVRLMYFGAFVGLTVLGVLLVFWQARLTEHAQLQADKDADRLRRQVAVLYEAETRSYRRPTQEEVDGLADRVYVLQRDSKFRTYRDLKLETRLLSAEILLFVAQRSRNAPRIEMLEGSEKVAGLLDDVKRPPQTEPQSDDERLDEASRRFQREVMDPLGEVGLSDAEERWFKKNEPAIDYYFETVRLFSERFDRRIAALTGDLKKAGVVDSFWEARYAMFRKRNEQEMRELGLQLAEVADKLPMRRH